MRFLVRPSQRQESTAAQPKKGRRERCSLKLTALSSLWSSTRARLGCGYTQKDVIRREKGGTAELRARSRVCDDSNPPDRFGVVGFAFDGCAPRRAVRRYFSSTVDQGWCGRQDDVENGARHPSFLRKHPATRALHRDEAGVPLRGLHASPALSISWGSAIPRNRRSTSGR